MSQATSLIEKLVSEFHAQRWKSDPMTLALRIAREHPAAIQELAVAVMKNIPEGSTFLDAALSFLPEDDWPKLVELALTRVEAAAQGNKQAPRAAEAILNYASFQCLPSLHPHLARLFELEEVFGLPYGLYPWRESGEQDFAALQARFNAESDNAETEKRKGAKRRRKTPRLRAWLAMLETRCLPVMEWALAHRDTLGLSEERVQLYLYEVGYRVQDGVFVPLDPQAVWHLCFEENFLPARPDFRGNHPTWHLPGTGPALRFGGVCSEGNCHLCGKALHHLLTLNPVPETLKVSELATLTLATCLSCLGWEDSLLYYQHDAQGAPHALVTNQEPVVEPHAPQFPSPPLRETMVHLVPTPGRWRWQDWGFSNGRENLHRVGGHPTWIQGAQYPECPQCQATMAFLLQLDSELPLQSDNQAEDGFLWGSGGIVYGFWCDACRISAFLWQCT